MDPYATAHYVASCRSRCPESYLVCDQTWAGFFDLIPTGLEEQILSLSGSEGDHAVTGGDCVRGVV